jgi:hypothetical protein
MMQKRGSLQGRKLSKKLTGKTSHHVSMISSFNEAGNIVGVKNGASTLDM